MGSHPEDWDVDSLNPTTKIAHIQVQRRLITCPLMAAESSAHPGTIF
jgi:hypothetical protein